MTIGKNAYLVTDLGPGDGGKGGAVHKIATMTGAHTVIKAGGAQGSHGVCTSRGERFAFSQWGCGTFEGIPTHISSNLVVAPEGLINEANMLRFEAGIDDPFALMTVDEDALCVSPLYGVASHLKELARGLSPRGTIGTGVGEAYRAAERHPDLAIFARDLSRPDIRDRIAAQREAIVRELEPVIAGEFLDGDRPAVEEELALLRDPGFVDHIAERYREVSRLAKIVDHGYLGREILSRDGNAVIECSHGVLTDRYQGFHPHTSAIRTLPRFHRAMLEEAGYDGRIVRIGVTRAYQIRHGAGPMPTADPEMGESLLPGSNKAENRWQGKVRVGPLDLELLRYAIASCGGPSSFDGLAVTWFDQVRKNGEWKLCTRYRVSGSGEFFDGRGRIKVRFGEDEEQLARQERLGRELLGCIPEIGRMEIRQDAERDELYRLCSEVLHESLNVPVRMVSFGPTEEDKMCR